jgi:hypothetical protein
MKSTQRPKAKMAMLFGAVLLFQCCCCIIPYSWSARLDSSTFAAPIEVDEEIYISPRESLKAEIPLDDYKAVHVGENAIFSGQNLEAETGYLMDSDWENPAHRSAYSSWLVD